jgi:hypothetical protein
VPITAVLKSLNWWQRCKKDGMCGHFSLPLTVIHTHYFNNKWDLKHYRKPIVCYLLFYIIFYVHIFFSFKNVIRARHQWLMPEIRRILIWSQPRQTVCEILSWKNPSPKRVGRVAQGVGPEFKPQFWKKKNVIRLYIPFSQIAYFILN